MLKLGEPALVPGEFEVAAGVGRRFLAGTDEESFDVAGADGFSFLLGLKESGEGDDFFWEGRVGGRGEQLLGGESGEAGADGLGRLGQDGSGFFEGDIGQRTGFTWAIRLGGWIEFAFTEQGWVGDPVVLHDLDELG